MSYKNTLRTTMYLCHLILCLSLFTAEANHLNYSSSGNETNIPLSDNDLGKLQNTSNVDSLVICSDATTFNIPAAYGDYFDITFNNPVQLLYLNVFENSSTIVRGPSILIKPGPTLFGYVESGSFFWAVIDSSGCVASKTLNHQTSSNEHFANYEIQNAPNPFSQTTNISYNLPENTKVSITIHDITGAVVEQLLDQQPKKAGNHSIEFNAKDLPKGMYFYTFSTPDFKEMKKMVIQ